MRDKRLEEIGAALFPAARRIVLTEPDNPRAAPVGDIVRAIPPTRDLSTITLAPSARDALVVARSLTPPGGLVCVTGSLYLVGEVRGLLGGGANV
jgi:dihydrofolate synthase/folylpolyglutamate synthase